MPAFQHSVLTQLCIYECKSKIVIRFILYSESLKTRDLKG